MALVLLCAVYAACAGLGGDAALYDAGVPLQLAVHRAQNISDVHYSLSFSIPHEKDSAVVGRAEISFKIDAPQEVVLDFRDLQSVNGVAVNGTAVQPLLRNEHIILPAAAMVAGDNSVLLSFVAGNQSLNRNEEFLYTLFVPDRARTAFPCFDQPSMKALFELTLEVPADWVAVSNTAVVADSVAGDRRVISFGRTEPLSTYLFSFVAGRFSHSTYCGEGRTITAYHRETDAARIAQLPVIFNQVVASLDWLEEYTGIAYPFAKYDFVILPGFQYGGMEHTGATLCSLAHTPHPTRCSPVPK